MRTSVVIVGAGHAGLAMSHCLSERSIDHVVLERGEIASSWKNDRWDSLRLLTPNWQSRLPGYGYQGGDADGYRTMPEVIDFIECYADMFSAPVETRTEVTSIRPSTEGYELETNKDQWRCCAVVIATGECNIPRVPAFAEALPSAIRTLTSNRYRNPDQLGMGGVLVVGASATGTQLADEIHRSNRPVTLAVGEHIRAPRVYRGKDIEWWMDAAGVLEERFDEVDDIRRARTLPSLQLAGSSERRTLDLNSLTSIGVKLVGRVAAVRDEKAQFSGSLRNQCALSDLKMNRLLDRFDEWATENGLDNEVLAPERFDPTEVEASPPLGMNLKSGEIETIIWATGFRPDYSWLEAPVFDRKGRIVHDGGVMEAPGMYLMGRQFLRRRKSALIDGAGDDALDLSAHLAGYLNGENHG